LLTVSGYRDSVALENALSLPGLSRPVIDRLVERRLIRIEDRGGARRIELTHDLPTGVVCSSPGRRRQPRGAGGGRVAAPGGAGGGRGRRGSRWALGNYAAAASSRRSFS